MRLGSAGDPLMWYISQPAKCGPLTSHFSRLPSDVRMNAPLRVPTNTRTLLIFSPFRDLRCSQSMFYMVVANSSASSSVRRMNANCFDICDKFFWPCTLCTKQSYLSYILLGTFSE